MEKKINHWMQTEKNLFFCSTIFIPNIVLLLVSAIIANKQEACLSLCIVYRRRVETVISVIR